MHPAFSVIFFTVSSGTGFGLFALLYLFDLAGAAAAQDVVWAGALALALVAAGLVSSTFHLANPRNAWRAVARFRTSWLSREGVFALLFFPLAAAYLGLTWWDAQGFYMLRLTAGVLATLLAWVTVFSTGMIYACLKTIRQWHTPLVPLNYLVLGHFAGALLLQAALPASAGLASVALALLLLAALLKGVYYVWVGKVPGASTIQTATGFTRAQVKLLDAGHTHGTFLTQEFGFQVARRHALALKLFVFAAGFGLPLLWLAGVSGAADRAVAGFSAASAVLGLLAERWLFFAEARHVVNLYHGAARC